MNTTSTLRLALSASLVTLACSGSRATPVTPPAPVVTAASDASTVVQADVAETPPADPRREAVLAAARANAVNAEVPVIVAGPIDFPDPEAQGTRVAAVVGSGSDARLLVTPVPFVDGAALTTPITITGAPQDDIAGLSTRDINGDHKPDLAVFLRREFELESYVSLQRFARLYTIGTTPERSLAPLIRAENQLLGVRDDAALAAAIPGLNTYEAPAEGMSPMRFIARLRFATPAQFRAAVASTGLRDCTDFPDRTGNRRKRCTTRPVARLTDALITGPIRRSLGTFVDVLSDDTNELTDPSCQRVGNELHCGANIGGPAGTDWAVVGEGASLRIIEISPWAESS